jgi:hypothetical protein
LDCNTIDTPGPSYENPRRRVFHRHATVNSTAAEVLASTTPLAPPHVTCVSATHVVLTQEVTPSRPLPLYVTRPNPVPPMESMPGSSGAVGRFRCLAPVPVPLPTPFIAPMIAKIKATIEVRISETIQVK